MGSMYPPNASLSTIEPSAEQRMREKLRDCLQAGCIISIEHAAAIRPRFTRWAVWGQPCCYRGDLAAMNDAIENCRLSHPDHVIRLKIEDFSFHSRMTLVVHRPRTQPPARVLKPADGWTGVGLPASLPS